jgi:hypothetical protein
MLLKSIKTKPGNTSLSLCIWPEGPKKWPTSFLFHASMCRPVAQRDAAARPSRSRVQQRSLAGPSRCCSLSVAQYGARHSPGAQRQKISPWPIRACSRWLPRAQAATWAWAGKGHPRLGQKKPGHCQPFMLIDGRARV